MGRRENRREGKKEGSELKGRGRRGEGEREEGRRIKTKRLGKDKNEKKMTARTQFFHSSFQPVLVAKRGQGHGLPRNTAQTGTTTTLG